MSNLLCKASIDANKYYSELRDTTKTEEYLSQASDSCLTLMDLLDNNEFDLSEAEAKRIHDRLHDLCDQLLYRTKDSDGQ